MSQSLSRGLTALFMLSKRRSLGVTELAEELDINKSTAYRILETLQQFNMAEQDKQTSKYRLGPAVLKLSEQLYKNMNIISIAKPAMMRLSDDIGESVHLCVLSNDTAVVIEQVMTDSRLTVNAKIGNNEPLHCSSVGKCLLAYNEHRDLIISRLNYNSYTDKTITSKDVLVTELDKIISLGYAIDDGELSEEIRCYAVPLFNNEGAVKYSIGISGPYQRMFLKTDKIILNLKRAGNMISEQLGYQLK